MPEYDIKIIENLLTSDECDKIISLCDGKLFTSKLYNDNDDLLDKKDRLSEQCWLKDEDNALVRNISDKIKDLTNTHKNYSEDLQVVKYGVGGFFKPHFDACNGDEKYCTRMNIGGPRYLTVLIYLNDDLEGGETAFPKIEKKVQPKKGRAVIFQNVDKNGHIIEQALHGGESVTKGFKWIANKWIHLHTEKQ
jgi:prolyl 4-hydroxylase